MNDDIAEFGHRCVEVFCMGGLAVALVALLIWG